MGEAGAMLSRIVGLDSFCECTGSVVVGGGGGVDIGVGGGTKSAWGGYTARRLSRRRDARHPQLPRSSGHGGDCVGQCQSN